MLFINFSHGHQVLQNIFNHFSHQIFTLNVIITLSKANFRYYQLQTFRVIATFLYILYIRQMVIFLLVFQWLRILLEIYDTSMIGTMDFIVSIVKSSTHETILILVLTNNYRKYMNKPSFSCN